MGINDGCNYGENTPSEPSYGCSRGSSNSDCPSGLTLLALFSLVSSGVGVSLACLVGGDVENNIERGFYIGAAVPLCLVLGVGAVIKGIDICTDVYSWFQNYKKSQPRA